MWGDSSTCSTGFYLEAQRLVLYEHEKFGKWLKSSNILRQFLLFQFLILFLVITTKEDIQEKHKIT